MHATPLKCTKPRYLSHSNNQRQTELRDRNHFLEGLKKFPHATSVVNFHTLQGGAAASSEGANFPTAGGVVGRAAASSSSGGAAASSKAAGA